MYYKLQKLEEQKNEQKNEYEFIEKYGEQIFAEVNRLL